MFGLSNVHVAARYKTAFSGCPYVDTGRCCPNLRASPTQLQYCAISLLTAGSHGATMNRTGCFLLGRTNSSLMDKEAVADLPKRNRAMQLLLPIKRAEDIVYGGRYAKTLSTWEIPVHINLLHVVDNSPDLGLLGSLLNRRKTLGGLSAEDVVQGAAVKLDEYQVPHTSRIVSGEVVFSILDTAELLECDMIVMPVTKPSSWIGNFSRNIARAVAQAAHSIPVITVDKDGLVCTDAPIVT